jgi:hypothetical protein
MKNILYLFLFLPFIGAAQETPQQLRGEVFRAYNSNPSQDTRETTIEVTRTLYRFTYRDQEIDKEYKDAVELFFKRSFSNEYDRFGKYKLKLEKRQGYIWVEGRRITEAP